MRDSDDLPYVVIERERGGVEPFLWGALLGAGVALLMAPRSGAETQREIRGRVRNLRDTAEGRVNDARDTLRGAVDRTRGEVLDRFHSVRGAVDAGRRAARDARSELERRLSDAKSAYGGGEGGAGAGTAADVVVTEVSAEDAGEGGLR
jgi:gas vesicle protein